MIMLELFKSRMASQGNIQAQAYLHNADNAIDKTVHWLILNEGDTTYEEII